MFVLSPSSSPPNLAEEKQSRRIEGTKKEDELLPRLEKEKIPIRTRKNIKGRAQKSVCAYMRGGVDGGGGEMIKWGDTNIQTERPGVAKAKARWGVQTLVFLLSSEPFSSLPRFWERRLELKVYFSGRKICANNQLV